MAPPHGAVYWTAQCVIVVFPGHTHLLFPNICNASPQRNDLTDDSQIIRAKEILKLNQRWSQSKTSIRNQPTDESFASGSSLSLRPDPLSQLRFIRVFIINY